MQLSISFTKLSPHAIILQRANDTDAWYDLCSVEDYLLQPWERKIFLTNIAMAIPVGYYGRVAPRSWLAAKYWIDVLAGVIDAWYRGDIGVVLLNTWNEAVSITREMRIAQLIIETYHEVDFQQVESLDDTVRWSGGWGSSGV